MRIMKRCTASIDADGDCATKTRASKIPRRPSALLHLIFLLCSAGAASNALASYDLQVTLHDDHDPVSVSGAYDYIIDVKNGGPDAVPNLLQVTVDLPLPTDVTVLGLPQTAGWSCQVVPFTDIGRCTHTGGISAGYVYSLIWKVKAPPYIPVSSGNTLSATATVSPGGFPADNDTFSESTKIGRSDLALEKFSDQDIVKIGAPYRYSLRVTNSSDTADTSRPSVVDQLPDGVVMLHAWGVGWNCGQNGQQVTCQQSWDASVPPASTSQPPQVGVAPLAMIDALARSSPGAVVNNATMTSSADSTPGNNTAQNSVTVNGTLEATDLQLTNVATGPATVPEGSPYSYVFTVKNNGPVSELGATTVRAVVPAAVTIVNIVEGNGWNCSWEPQDSVPENWATCTGAGLASGATAAAITVNVLAGPPGTDRVRAWVTGTADTIPANNVQDATKTVVASTAPDLSITKTANPAFPSPVGRGAQVIYTLKVKNLAAVPSVGTTTVTDVLPGGVGLISAGGWPCTEAGGTVTCTRTQPFSGSAPDITLWTSAPTQLQPDPIVNRAVVSSTAGDSKIANNVATAPIALANASPIAVDDAYAMLHGQTLVVDADEGLLVNDGDDNDDPIFAIVGSTLPAYGQLTGPNADGGFAYEPDDPIFTGTDSFSYRVSDSVLESDEATVTITIGNNLPPTIIDQGFTIAEGDYSDNVVYTIDASDPDGQPQPLTYAITQGDVDTFAIDPGRGDITLTSALDYETQPSYTLTVAVFDGELTSTATLTVTVANVDNGPGVEPAPPALVDDAIQVAPGGIATTLIDGADSVLANDVLANDVGINLIASPDPVYGPTFGIVTLNSEGKFTYENTDMSATTDFFGYQACDSQGLCNTANVTITISNGPVNRLPVAVDDAIQVTPGGTADALITGEASVLANDFDLDLDPFMVTTVLIAPAHGIFTLLDPSGTFHYANTPGDPATTDNVVYEVCDPFGACDAGNVTITISNGTMNSAPTAGPDAIHVAPGGTANALVTGEISVLSNDTDLNLDALTVTSVLVAPVHGTLALGSIGTFTYDNTLNDPATGDSFTYEVCDPHGACDAGTVTITVGSGGPGNQAPIADPQTLATPQDASLPITLTATDPDGDPLTFAIVAGPGQGGTLSGTPPNVVYQPPAGFNGTETFTFKATDPSLADSNVATVTITVGNGGAGNQAPVVDSQALTTPQDVALPITLTSTDPDGDLLTFDIVAQPNQGGTLTGTPPNVVYTPSAGFNGIETFTFKANDGALDSNIGTVTVTVGNGGASNQAPVADAQTLTTPQDVSLPITLTATDPDGDLLSFDIVTPPNQGGTLSGTLPNIVYTPPVGFNGVETFTFKSDDAQLDSNIATVTITVGSGGPGNQAPVADPQALTTAQDVALPITLTATDPDGDALTYAIVAPPSGGGQLAGTPPNVVYTPAAGFNGIETFTFKATDTSLLDSNIATVTITVGSGGAGNQAPVADPQTLATPQDVSLPITLSAADPDGDTLAFDIVAVPNQGGQLTGAPPNVVYTPASGFNGVETFTFKANDGTLDSNVAAVTITVGSGGAGNQAPVADPQTLTTPQGTSLAITLSATDPDNDPLTFAVVAVPNQGGQLTGTAPNMVYTPATGFNGIETFSFKANDGTLDSNVATVTITVGGGGPGNQAPVANPQSLATAQDVALSITLSATDPDGDTLGYAIVAIPNQGGQLTGTPPNLVYAPAAGFNGIETFTFKANDGALDSNIATVTITVGSGGPGNQAPVADSQTLTTPQDVALPMTLTATDPDGDTMSYSIVATPNQGGQLTGTPPNVVYIPSVGFNGLETFTFKANDGTLDSNVATVTITVGNGGANTPPVIADQNFSVAEGRPQGFVIGTVTASDSDGPQALTYTITGGNTGGAFAINSSSGQITVAGSLDFESLPAYTLLVSASDGADASDANVRIAITDVVGGPGVESLPPVVVDDAIQVVPGGTTSVLIGGADNLLANDSDPDGNVPLTAELMADPSAGTVMVNPDGTFTYTNTNSSAMSDTFDYRACDALGVCSDGVVMITISNGPVDLLPVAEDDAVEVAPGGTANVLVGGETSVLANDTDPDVGDTLHAIPLTEPAHGVLTLNPSGTFSYANDGSDPASTDSFIYEACDTFGACAAAEVTISISPELPIVNCVLPTQVHEEGDTVALDLSRLFTPPQGQGLSYSASDLPSSLSVDAGTGLLAGTLQPGDVIGSPYLSQLMATTVPGGATASGSVNFVVLASGEILWRNGFDGPSSAQPCQ